jgi:hypothetical protein
MSWHSMHHSAPLKIAIVGGGVASLVAGITLRESAAERRDHAVHRGRRDDDGGPIGELE